MYMTVYTCECCNFTTNNKTKYKRHLDTKKHQYMFKSYEKTKSEEEERTCKYCMKCFKYKQGLYRHMKYYCKKNDDEDLKELVRLMNEQLAQKSKELEEEKNKYFKEKERNSKMIKKLADKLQINLVVNNHIRLLNYKDTDLSHLTTTDYIKAINCVNYAIPSMVKMIHFNPNKPENMNVYIPNIKDKYILIFNGNEWQLKNRSKELNNLIDDNLIHEVHRTGGVGSRECTLRQVFPSRSSREAGGRHQGHRLPRRIPLPRRRERGRDACQGTQASRTQAGEDDAVERPRRGAAIARRDGVSSGAAVHDRDASEHSLVHEPPGRGCNAPRHHAFLSRACRRPRSAYVTAGG